MSKRRRRRISREIYFAVECLQQDATLIAELVAEWYRERARMVFARRVEFWTRHAPALCADEPTYRVRRMTRRWGSCAPSGAITLNPELVKMPTSCIDYVIVHELCHRRVMSHGRRFYNLLARYIPNWEQRRDQLNNAGR